MTAPLLRQYLLYLVLFYAVYQLVRTPSEAVLLCSVFMVSCLFVGFFSLICAGGVLHPAYIGATHAFGRRMGAEVQMGALMRIAATTLDFNQGVFPLLLALPMASLLWPNSPRSDSAMGRARRCAGDDACVGRGDRRFVFSQFYLGYRAGAGTFLCGMLAACIA